MAEIQETCWRTPNEDCQSWSFWVKKARTHLGVDEQTFMAPTGYALTYPEERYIEFAARTGCPIGGERYKALNRILRCAAGENDREKVDYFLQKGADDIDGAVYEATRRGHDKIAIGLLDIDPPPRLTQPFSGRERGLAERGNMSPTPVSLWNVMIGASRGGHYDLAVLAMAGLTPQNDRLTLIGNILKAWGEGGGRDSSFLDLLPDEVPESFLLYLEQTAYALGQHNSREALNQLEGKTKQTLGEEFRYGQINGGHSQEISELSLHRVAEEIGSGGVWSMIPLLERETMPVGQLDRVAVVTDETRRYIRIWESLAEGAASVGQIDLIRLVLPHLASAELSYDLSNLAMENGYDDLADELLTGADDWNEIA